MNKTCFSEFDWMDLRLFDGEGGVPAGAGEAPAGAGEAPAPADAQGAEAAAAPDSGAVSAEDRFAEAMNDPDFKAAYEKRLQGDLSKRMKGQKSMQRELENQRKTLTELRAVFGADDDKSLLEAVKNNQTIISERAAEMEMSNEAYIKYQQMAIKNAAHEEADRQREIAEYQEMLDREFAEVQQKHPEFDPDAEMENPDFVGMLRMGISADAAYAALHPDRVMNQVARQAALEGAQRAYAETQARKNRPVENAAGGRPAAGVSMTNVDQMTRKDREEVERRALRGERITLK